MRKAALLYNSRSGGRRNGRATELKSILKILSEAGIEVSLTFTQSSADATQQAGKAIIAGCDTIFACGGDGTVHDVLQAVAGTRVALGVIPMGTANALAHDINLPLHPVKAAQAAVHAVSHRIAVGRLQARGFDGDPLIRYFTVAVGIGVDAHLFYKLHSGLKQHMGIAAYYAQAWQLWFTHRMEKFVVKYEDAGSGVVSRSDVTEMLAVRIRNFGGMLRELAPGASLDRNDLRIVLSRTSNRLSYLLYVIRGLLGAHWHVRGVELAHSERVRCDYPSAEPGSPATGPRVYVEADGELLGTLPAEITMIPDALTVLAARRP